MLPPHLIKLADPNITALESALEEAIASCLTGKPCGIWEGYNALNNVYAWRNIAQRTEKVYQKISNDHQRCFNSRLKNYLMVAPVAGKIYCVLIILDAIILLLLDLFFPRKHIDQCHHYCKGHSLYEKAL